MLYLEVSMKKFTKRVEDFTCKNCGENVSGDGFTNHCPKCLYSKHVDTSPGDRSSSCNGIMKPVLVELEKGEYILTHKCQKCGHTKRNKVAKDDDFDEILKLSKTIA